MVININGRNFVPVRRIIKRPNFLSLLEQHCNQSEALVIDQKPIEYEFSSERFCERRSVYIIQEGKTPKIFTIIDQIRRKDNRRLICYRFACPVLI